MTEAQLFPGDRLYAPDLWGACHKGEDRHALLRQLLYERGVPFEPVTNRFAQAQPEGNHRHLGAKEGRELDHRAHFVLHPNLTRQAPSHGLGEDLVQVILHRGLPFAVQTFNEETRRVLRESEEGVGVIHFDSAEALFEDLGI